MAKSLPHPVCLSPDGILQEIQINLLECKVCFERFGAQQGTHRPQNLSCGHVLCLECITALSHPLLRKLECPFCRQLCSVDNISQCQVLSDLQELLLYRNPTSTNQSKGKPLVPGGLAYKPLHLHSAFGGWGTLINPTAIAILGTAGTIVVVHDGEKRVVVFSPQGKKLRSFGQRGDANEEIRYPVDVAVTPSGYVVVTDAGDHAVKIFTSRGNHVLTIRDSFQLPWAVNVDRCGRILISDVQAGTLSQVQVDYGHGVTLENRTVISDLQQPKAVAVCGSTGNIAVIEHSTTTQRSRNSRLTVLSPDFHPLYQIDSFSLSLQFTLRLNTSSVAFDKDGGVIVCDSDQGMICSLGKLQNGPVLTPLAGDHLVRPVGLVSLNDKLIVVDGDHTVKFFSTEPDLSSVEEKTYGSKLRRTDQC